MYKSFTMKKVISWILAMMCVLSVVTITASAYSSGSYTVSTSAGVNVRAGAGSGYSKVGAAAQGVTFTVSSINGSWGYTSSIRCTNGYRSGWVCLNYCCYNGSGGGGNNSRSTYNDVFASVRGSGYQLSQAQSCEASSFTKGTFVYVWAYLHDINGNLYKSYGNGTCNMTLSIYRPNGSCAYTYTYNDSDNNWIGQELDTAGTWKIQSKITGSLTGTNTRSITVKDTSSTVYPSRVSLSRDSVTINKGGTTTISATIVPSNATDKSIKWSSSDSKVASVDSGKIKALKPGRCTIYAQASNGKTSACAVCVRGIAFGLPLTVAYVGDKGTIKPTACAVSSAMTWTSSDKSVATVDSSGRITAKKEGSTTIAVKTQDGYSASIVLIVRGTTKKAQGFFGSSDPVTVRLNAGCDNGKIKIQCKAGNGIDFNNEFIVTLKDKKGSQIWRGTVKSVATLILGNDHSEYVVCIERKSINNPIYISNTFEWIITCSSNCYIV